MNKENPISQWEKSYKNKNVSLNQTPRIIPSALEKAGDELVWAIETVIEHPTDIKCWFLVKDAIANYKAARRKQLL